MPLRGRAVQDMEPPGGCRDSRNTEGTAGTLRPSGGPTPPLLALQQHRGCTDFFQATMNAGGAWGSCPLGSCPLGLSLPAGTRLSSGIPGHQLGLPYSGTGAGCSQLSHKWFLCCSKGPAAPSPRDAPTQGWVTHPCSPWGQHSPPSAEGKSRGQAVPFPCRHCRICRDLSRDVWTSTPSWVSERRALIAPGLDQSRGEPPQEAAHAVLC